MSLEEKTERARALLRQVSEAYPGIRLASSFGAEDMVLTDMIADLGGIGVFTLDTGRLHEETHALMQEVRTRYPALDVAVYCPDAARLEAWVNAHGNNAFYESVALRKGCCAVRKLEPLDRALQGATAWITGLRAAQSPTRDGVAEQETDAAHGGIAKINPLADWSEAEVWAYLRAHAVPYNSLHDRHFPSIGCAPCTRAVTVGEDIRSGRWWWENPGQRECGLHRPKEGR